MAINARWHAAHPMPKRPTVDQRIRWHEQHQRHCGCRPIPAKLAALMTRAEDSPIVVRGLLKTDWPAIERLFGPNGACGGCWCMYWRSPSRSAFEQIQGARARGKLRRLVTTGAARGILAFQGDEPVGWCSFGPRTDFPNTENKPSYAVDDADQIWSVNCFFVRRGHRRKGVSGLLLACAIDEARRQGAKTLEAYPTVVRPGTRQADAFVFKGTLPLFERAGFRVVQRINPGSPLVRLALRAGRR
ncbi:MAG: GNAT family N-acetyltransferase [Deltaproteobacteria bacterium]|nr:GNAT family N-acetyltransferase [Deltaproteobacteria bacterium]